MERRADGVAATLWRLEVWRLELDVCRFCRGRVRRSGFEARHDRHKQSYVRLAQQYVLQDPVGSGSMVSDDLHQHRSASGTEGGMGNGKWEMGKWGNGKIIEKEKEKEEKKNQPRET